MALSKAFHPLAVIHDLKRTIASIREQWRSTRRENERLRNDNEPWRERAERLEREREQLREENERLKRNSKKPSGPRSGKRRRVPAAFGNNTRSAPAASPAPPMGSGTVNRFRTMSMT